MIKLNIIKCKTGIVVLLLCLFTSSAFVFERNSSLEGYRIQSPDKVITLPAVLNEVSGVTRIDDSTVACIQDENGILFIVDLLNSKVKHQYRFHIDGDYEGVAKVDQTIYVLRSDGTLFEIMNYSSPGFKLKSYVTGIPANNNEGLCYDSRNNRLLIASKSNPVKGREYKDIRIIYAFDLSKKKLDYDPVYSFDLGEIRSFAVKNKIDVPTRSGKAGTIQHPVIRFRTSAIDFHPVTGKLFLLSAVDHLLFIFDARGRLEHIEKLNRNIFNKAEGITFFRNGDMLITNEAQDKKPTLLRFNYRK